MSKNIVLTGIMGCGKTVIGMNIATILGYKFVDVDEYIESTFNQTIAQLFENGEEYFRNIEESAIKELAQESNLIISTGGGAVLRQSNVDNLKKNGIIFFINRPIKTIVKIIETSHRPLLASGCNALYDIFETRYPIYKRTCDYEIVGEKTIKETVAEIIEKYKAQEIL